MRSIKFIVFCTLYSVLCTLVVSAKETIVVGEIVNETTGEPIPNVNIHFKGTKIGTTSDETGAYALRVDMQAKAQLVFSAVGYYTQRFEVEPGAMAGLQVALRERSAVLTEVVVAPNENPALEILRQVRAHRPENDRTLHPERAFTAQRAQNLYISHIGKKQLRRALWRSLQAGMIAQEDSTFLLPLYRETQTFRLTGTQMIPANDQLSQALILTSTDYSSLLGGEGNLNFYANSVPLMGHAFLSPLATSGNLYYRYYLDEDETHPSLQGGDGGRLVTIRFRTRNPFYPTFNGEMVIDTTTFALRALHAYVPAEVAVNYVNNLHVSQTLADDSSIADEQISVLLDFAVQMDKAGTIFPTLLLTTGLTNNERAPIRDTGTPEYRDSVPLARVDSAFQALDTIPLIRAAKFFATIATTGYIPTGTPVDIGHVEEILQINRHEGVHVGLPFRTNERFSKVVSLEASVGYGFRDRRFKGLGRVSINLPTPRKNTLDFQYRDGYVWSEVDDFDRLLRENSMGWGNFDFTAYAFEALHRDSLCVNTSMLQRQLQAHWFADWGDRIAAGLGHPLGLETHAYLRAGWQGGVAYQTLSAIARLSWGERKYDGFFSRRYAYSSRYPVLFLGLETGHWSSADQASQLYAHLRLLLTQHANLGMGGTLTYAFQAGAIFGQVPSFLLWQANGNQGYAYDPYRFTLLHGRELMADKYAALHTEWNGMGILFNLIPGIRYLHLRELVEAKIAYGYLSKSVCTLSVSETNGLYSISPKGGLYSEIGIGIGNILRVCDLYSVWSLSPKVQWTMRFRIHLGL